MFKNFFLIQHRGHKLFTNLKFLCGKGKVNSFINPELLIEIRNSPVLALKLINKDKSK